MRTAASIYHCVFIPAFTFQPLRACWASFFIRSDLVARQFLFGVRWRRHRLHSVATCWIPFCMTSIFCDEGFYEPGSIVKSGCLTRIFQPPVCKHGDDQVPCERLSPPAWSRAAAGPGRDCIWGSRRSHFPIFVIQFTSLCTMLSIATLDDEVRTCRLRLGTRFHGVTGGQSTARRSSCKWRHVAMKVRVHWRWVVSCRPHMVNCDGGFC